MSWAARRRLVILLILAGVGISFATVVLISVAYETPSCFDGVQNQDEDGIDCGGSCSYLCTELQLAPTVLFTKALPHGDGRTSVIALIENKNSASVARAVPYAVRFYGEGQILLREEEGIIDLPSGSTVPIFVPNVDTGRQTVTAAFLSLNPAAIRWEKAAGAPAVPSVVSTHIGGTSSAPRIEAVFSNQSVTPLTSVRSIVIVRDTNGSVIGASSTVTPSVPAQGEARATFTWNEPFVSVPATIEVIPIGTLP